MLNFLSAQYGTISDIEVAWFLLAAVGLIFSIYNIREAWRDRVAIRIAGIGNGRRLIANLHFRSEIARATVQSIFLIIGILAMTIRDVEVQNAPLNITLTRIAVTWGLIAASALISLKSYWAFSARRELRNVIAEEHNVSVPVGEVVVEEKDEA